MCVCVFVCVCVSWMLQLMKVHDMNFTDVVLLAEIGLLRVPFGWEAQPYSLHILCLQRSASKVPHLTFAHCSVSRLYSCAWLTTICFPAVPCFSAFFWKRSAWQLNFGRLFDMTVLGRPIILTTSGIRDRKTCPCFAARVLLCGSSKAQPFILACRCGPLAFLRPPSSLK